MPKAYLEVLTSILENARRSGVEHIDVHVTTGEEQTVRIDVHDGTPKGTRRQIGTAKVRYYDAILVEDDVATAARFHPCEMRIGVDDGPWRPVTKKRFLAGACRTETFGRYTLGVAKGTWDHSFPPCEEGSPDTCEAGLLHTRTLARTTDAYGTAHWSVRAETNEPALPREYSDEKAERQTLRTRSWHVLYAAMADGPDTAASRSDWLRATQMGIALAPPRKALLPWRTPSAQDRHTDTRPTRRLDERREIGPGTVLVDESLDPVEAGLLARAGAIEPRALRERLMTPANALEGFEWYDDLPRIVRVRTRVLARDGVGRVTIVDPRDRMDYASAVGSTPRPERIRLVLTVQATDGTESKEMVETDLAFAGEPGAYADETFPLVRRETSLTACGLASLMEDVLFEPCDDPEVGSAGAQRTRFADEALDIATRLLCDDEEALRVRLAQRAQRHLSGLVTEYAHGATIRIDADATVDVTVAERSDSC